MTEVVDFEEKEWRWLSPQWIELDWSSDDHEERDERNSDWREREHASAHGMNWSTRMRKSAWGVGVGVSVCVIPWSVAFSFYRMSSYCLCDGSALLLGADQDPRSGKFSLCLSLSLSLSYSLFFSLFLAQTSFAERKRKWAGPNGRGSLFR